MYEAKAAGRNRWRLFDEGARRAPPTAEPGRRPARACAAASWSGVPAWSRCPSRRGRTAGAGRRRGARALAAPGARARAAGRVHPARRGARADCGARRQVLRKACAQCGVARVLGAARSRRGVGQRLPAAAPAGRLRRHRGGVLAGAGLPAPGDPGDHRDGDDAGPARRGSPSPRCAPSASARHRRLRHRLLLAGATCATCRSTRSRSTARSCATSARSQRPACPPSSRSPAPSGWSPSPRASRPPRRAALHRLGCPLAQGYLVSRPCRPTLVAAAADAAGAVLAEPRRRWPLVRRTPAPGRLPDDPRALLVARLIAELERLRPPGAPSPGLVQVLDDPRAGAAQPAASWAPTRRSRPGSCGRQLRLLRPVGPGVHPVVRRHRRRLRDRPLARRRRRRGHRRQGRRPVRLLAALRRRRRGHLAGLAAQRRRHRRGVQHRPAARPRQRPAVAHRPGPVRRCGPGGRPVPAGRSPRPAARVRRDRGRRSAATCCGPGTSRTRSAARSPAGTTWPTAPRPRWRARCRPGWCSATSPSRTPPRSGRPAAPRSPSPASSRTRPPRRVAGAHGRRPLAARSA